ncbi:MAG: hypothetical protein AB7F28_05695 [Candidatus Margulisiibacteriota bacterium]
MINDAILEGFSEEDMAVAVGLIEKRLVQEAMLSPLDKPALAVMGKLILTVEAPALRNTLVSGLSKDDFLAMVKGFSNPQTLGLFESLDEVSWLEALFKKAAKPLQKEILMHVYAHRKDLYEPLRKLSSDRLRMVGGVLIPQERVLKKMIEPEIHRILDIIEDPKLSVENAALEGHRALKQFEQDDVEQLASQVVALYQRQLPELSDAVAFTQFLKFLYFVEPFLKVFQSIQKAISPASEHLIDTLAKLPDDTWFLKVLVQVPEGVIAAVVQRVTHHDGVRLERRNVYVKVLARVKAVITLPEAEKIRLAMGD